MWKFFWDKKVKLRFAFVKFKSNTADMPKMEPYRDFKASIDYKLKSSIDSIDFFSFLYAKASKDF